MMSSKSEMARISNDSLRSSDLNAIDDGGGGRLKGDEFT